MAEPTARIRPFAPSDDKLVHFLIGKANMESLSVANRQAYLHPLTITVWLTASSIFTEFMQWWPNGEYGFLGYFNPLRAFASMAVPILFLIDWINRPYFVEHLEDVLRRPDLVDIKKYYSRSPSSGFWILEYDKEFVGLIALDASTDSTNDEPIVTKEASKISYSKGTSPTATIRHFYVDEIFRSSKIQSDLLNHAVQRAFGSDPALRRIRAPDSPLIPYVREALRLAGFQLEQNTEKVGVFGWKLGLRVLEKADWK